MPRNVAHVLLLEPQLWKALALLVSGRARRRRAGTFSYWHPGIWLTGPFASFVTVPHRIEGARLASAAVVGWS